MIISEVMNETGDFKESSFLVDNSGGSSVYSSALDSTNNTKVAIKKLARPFQTTVHAKRTYRELRMLKHMNHENVTCVQ